MIDFNKDNYAKNLPDSFQKNTDSNNYKILENERLSVEEHLADLYGIYEILNIDNAYGKTLDRYGERVGQARGLATDSQYIFMIKAKIMRALGNGTSPSILKSLCMTFGCEADTIKIEDGIEPCSVTAIVSSRALSLIALNTEGIINIIKSLLPVCVNLDFRVAVGLTNTLYAATSINTAMVYTITPDINKKYSINNNISTATVINTATTVVVSEGS